MLVNHAKSRVSQEHIKLKKVKIMTQPCASHIQNLIATYTKRAPLRFCMVITAVNMNSISRREKNSC